MDLFDIGESIKRARKEARMTQRDLSEASGVSMSKLDMIENGRAPDVGFKSVLRLMNAVGLDLRMTTFNAGRPTLDDLQSENDEEGTHAPRMGR